jgi:hypothetical protein
MEEEFKKISDGEMKEGCDSRWGSLRVKREQRRKIKRGERKV